VLGYQDECWWSRVSEPNLHAWVPEDEPLRLLDKQVAQGEPKALACYGLLRGDTGAMLLRFAEGRPESEQTEAFLAWVCQELAAEGKEALLLIWDNAAWHTSGRVRAWIRAHNRTVRQQGGVRIVVCYLPTRSPWLNNIEPKWIHGKRAVAEPAGVLAGSEVIERVYDYYHAPLLPHLSKAFA
jgi:DDE superfamily endonuclease